MKIQNLLMPIFLLVLLLAGSIGFWYFENSFLIKIILVFLVFSAIAWYFWQKDYRWPIFLAFFLTIYNLDNLHFGISLPLSAIMILVFGLTVLFAHLLLKKPNVFYLSFLGFLVLELFLTLSYWPANPLSKSMLVVTGFFLLGELTSMRLENVLSWKKAQASIIIATLIIFATVATTQWYGL